MFLINDPKWTRQAPKVFLALRSTGKLGEYPKTTKSHSFQEISMRNGLITQSVLTNSWI